MPRVDQTARTPMTPPPPTAAWRSRRGVAVLATAVGLVVAVAWPAGGAPAKGRADLPPAPMTVAIDAAGPAGPVIPADFLGLSIEARQLTFPQTDATVGNLAAMLRSLGTGTIRFGGDTVETTAFVGGPHSAKVPSDYKPAYVVTPADLARLAGLAQASGWRIILGVNLGHYDPDRAGDEVASAQAVLGSALIGAEVGNEPNAYVQRGLRSSDYSIASYQTEFAAYRDAIAAQSPAVPVVGSSSYPPSFLNGFDPGLGYGGAFVTQHLYPLNACSSTTPTIPLLLARSTSARQASDTRQGLGVAAAHGLPLRLTESNSVICSGYNGVSNTLAGALWTVDHLLQSANLGVAGVNLHGGIQVCGAPTSAWYTPLCANDAGALAANTFTAQPDFYGMELVSRLVGTAFVRTTYATRQNVVVRATRDGTGTVRAVVNDMDPNGTSDSLVKLVLPVGYDEAQVERLSGPALESPAVTMDGTTIAGDGSLTGAVAPERVVGRGGVTYVRVPAGSAALITLVPRCTVPAVKGLTLTDARTKLAASGCVSGLIAQPRVAPGVQTYVVRQALPPGFRYRIGQPVHLQLKPKAVPKPKPKPLPKPRPLPKPTPAPTRH